MDNIGSTNHELTFADLHVHYYTGRSYLVSGEGRNKVVSYRSGVMTDIGDLTDAEWHTLLVTKGGRSRFPMWWRYLLRRKKASSITVSQSGSSGSASKRVVSAAENKKHLALQHKQEVSEIRRLLCLKGRMPQ